VGRTLLSEAVITKKERDFRAALQMADWRLAQRSVAAPVGGRVADILAEPGETMMAGAPVV
jgi:HlyD family secretion protein